MQNQTWGGDILTSCLLVPQHLDINSPFRVWYSSGKHSGVGKQPGGEGLQGQATRQALLKFEVVQDKPQSTAQTSPDPLVEHQTKKLAGACRWCDSACILNCGSHTPLTFGMRELMLMEVY